MTAGTTPASRLCAFPSCTPLGRTLGFCIVLLVGGTRFVWAEPAAPRLRRPAALVLHSPQSLVVANRSSGTVSEINPTTANVTRELQVGKKLEHLVVGPHRQFGYVVDSVANELILISMQQPKWQVVSRTTVAATPVNISLLEGGTRVSIASLWSRRLTIVDVSNPRQPQPLHVLDLDFAPREQIVLPDKEHLLVADAFAGRLAVVKVDAARVVQQHQLEAHNLRGFALSPSGRSLLVPHQMLDAHATTTKGGVHWGDVLLNVVRTVNISRLLKAPAGPPTAGDLYYLGHPDRATGDPTGMLSTKDRRQILAYAGTDEVAISDPGPNYFKRVAVGRRPVAMVLTADEQTLYVANHFSDSISVIDVKSAKQIRQISLGAQPKPTPEEEGELLFYDARLSSDGWFSCHSCHTDGHTNGMLSDNFGDGSVGASKRVHSLLGVGETAPWAWNGKVDSLATQVRKSILTTMRGPQPSKRQVESLTAYLRTLQPPPALARARGNLNVKSFTRGQAIFEAHGCASCHKPGTYTSGESFDVDLPDRLGNRMFNPPSLRGVSQRDRLFHDNRAQSIREVLTKFQHGLDAPLAEQALSDLLEFLRGI